MICCKFSQGLPISTSTCRGEYLYSQWSLCSYLKKMSRHHMVGLVITKVFYLFFKYFDQKLLCSLIPNLNGSPSIKSILLPLTMKTQVISFCDENFLGSFLVPLIKNNYSFLRYFQCFSKKQKKFCFILFKHQVAVKKY